MRLQVRGAQVSFGSVLNMAGKDPMAFRFCFDVWGRASPKRGKAAQAQTRSTG